MAVSCLGCLQTWPPGSVLLAPEKQYAASEMVLLSLRLRGVPEPGPSAGDSDSAVQIFELCCWLWEILFH